MKRRDFITLLGGAAAWPLGARAQQRERTRRIGVLMNLTPGDPEAQNRIAGFLQGLQELSWTVGRNVRVDYRWGGDGSLYRRGADVAAQICCECTNAAQTAMICSVEPGQGNDTPLQNRRRTTQIATPQSGDAKAA
jgi:hypothetical protein